MIRMGTIWDRTVEVLQGRTAILASLATLYILLPNIVASGVGAWAGPEGGLRVAAGLVQIVATVLLILGMLAITAVATDPAVTRERATAIGVSRLGAGIGTVLLLGLIAVLAFVPAAGLIMGAGARMTAAGRLDMSQASGGMVAFGTLYALVALVIGLIVSAKLSPLFAVIVNERLGLRAIARAWRLTRGSTARLVGVILLYVIVLVVVMAAVSSITGIFARLLLGAEADAAVTFVVGAVTAIVTTVATVVQAVFYAQFYVAAAGAPGRVAQPAA